MASDSPVENPLQYACKCLNVQIISSIQSQSPASSPEGTCDPAYAPVFVNDDGIVITHPQVTVRTTTHAEPIPGTDRYSRFTVLTCLFCRLPIYRVFQTISFEAHGKESVLLPTDDWVERDILKSATGWIQVHKDSIVGDSISQAKLSSSYARSFSLLLPPPSSPPLSPAQSPSPSPKMNTETQPSNSPEPPTQSCLSELRSLFFPPPFTPSHPIFVHLASIANNESQHLRATAQQRIADLVKAETAGIEAREQELKHQVEVLWKSFRNHLNTLQQEPQQTSNVVRSPVSRSSGFAPSKLGAPISNPSSVTVRSFNPVPISPPLSPPSSVPRISALSASLATSTFHHPNANQVRSSPPARSPDSYRSVSSRSLSTQQSKSSTLVPDAVPMARNNVLQFGRNINDTINTQASYKYFVNLEEDMARYKRRQEAAMREQQEAEAAKRAQQTPPSQAVSGTHTNGNLKHNIIQTSNPPTSTEDGSAKDAETTSPRGRDKGKRKVTFDVEPAVIKVEEDGKVKEDVTAEQDAREMMFALDDLEVEEEDSGDSLDRPSTLPLLEQPVSRSLRPKKTRPQNNIELFASLRPSSLPNPSDFRPMRGQPHVDSSSQAMLPRSKVLSTLISSGLPSPPGLSPKITTEHDAELLRLVAADTPSHRGAWTPNSRAWQTFTRRQEGNIAQIPEEGEETEETNLAMGRSSAETADHLTDDDYDVTSLSQAISSSVPISIVIRKKIREPLTLSSYRPKSAMPSSGDAPSLPHGQKMPLSSSIRKAKYAERDQSRSMDPGALDFATEEDEDDSEEEMDQITPMSGERGRKQALKILKARNELPEAGMWRSLV